MSPRENFLIQTTLDHWVSGIKRKPCYLERLPAELFLEILSYLPYETKCAIRHRDPFQLPEVDELPRLLGPTTRAPSVLDTLSDCPANRVFERGCEKYCSKELYPWNWLQVTRVSQAWRTACLTSRRFWTRVPLHKWTIARDAIERSGEFPLHVYFSATQNQSHGLKTALELGVDRISELTMSCGSLSQNDYMDTVNILDEVHFPKLRKWCFRSHPYATYTPITLFKGIIPPTLYHLELEDVNLIFCRNLFPSILVHLQLNFCHNVWRTAHDMADTLRSAPLLQQLLLFGDPCFPADMFHSTCMLHAEPPIILRDLSALQVSADSRVILNLLKTLHIPFACSLELTLQHENRMDPGLSNFLTTFLRKQLEPMNRDVRSFTHVRFQIEQHKNAKGPASHWAMIRMGWGSTNSEHAAGTPSHLTIRHTWQGDTETTVDIARDVHSLMKDYISALPHLGVESLSIEPWVYSSYLHTLEGERAFLLGALSHFSGVRHIILAFDIADALSWLVLESQLALLKSRSPPISMFPALQTLELRRSKFPFKFAVWLKSYINWRKDVLVKPCTLKLVHCYADNEDAEDEDKYNITLGFLSKIPGVQFANDVEPGYPDLEAPLGGLPERWFM